MKIIEALLQEIDDSIIITILQDKKLLVFKEHHKILIDIAILRPNSTELYLGIRIIDSPMDETEIQKFFFQRHDHIISLNDPESLHKLQEIIRSAN